MGGWLKCIEIYIFSVVIICQIFLTFRIRSSGVAQWRGFFMWLNARFALSLLPARFSIVRFSSLAVRRLFRNRYELHFQNWFYFY